MPERTTIIIYGKGGVGKSTISSHLSVAFQRMGKRVLLVGCDPKADTSVRLLGGQRAHTIVDMVVNNGGRGFDENVTRTASGVDVLETGGPAPGVGCGGRGVATLCQFLDDHPLELGRYEVVIFDVLGDLVCGGFVSPLRFGKANSVYIVSSEEAASSLQRTTSRGSSVSPITTRSRLAGSCSTSGATACPRSCCTCSPRR